MKDAKLIFIAATTGLVLLLLWLSERGEDRSRRLQRWCDSTVDRLDKMFERVSRG